LCFLAISNDYHGVLHVDSKKEKKGATIEISS
jgi:hypothetical protein